MNNSTTRRTIIKSSLAFSAAALTLRNANLISAEDTQVKGSSEQPASAAGLTILFQGDSITDAGRDRTRKVANDQTALGKGYPLLIASELLRDHAKMQLSIHNRGISGNKVPDLDKRWDEDCLKIQPDLLSILIGVNDLWHKLNGKYDGTVDDYYTGYTALIKRTQETLPKTRIVVCEPFVLRCGAVKDTWFPEFEERRAMAERIATEHSLDFVPFQKMFNEATQNAEAKYWAADGVHPTLAGHALMAKTWLEVTKI